MAEMIRPRELSAVPGSVNPGAAIIVDDGLLVQKATPLQLVDAARPLASAEDATSLTDNTKLMSPFRVGQAIAATAVTYSAGDGLFKTGTQFSLDQDAVVGISNDAGFLNKNIPVVLRAPAGSQQGNGGAYFRMGMGGTGEIVGPESGTYTFIVRSDDTLAFEVKRRDGSGAKLLSFDPATTVASFLVPPMVATEQVAMSGMGNVGAYEMQSRDLQGTYARRPNSPRGIEAGYGDHYIDRYIYAPRINGKVTDVGGGAGVAPVISPFGVFARVGGTNLDAVAEVAGFHALFDVASPNANNANVVGMQARVTAGFQTSDPTAELDGTCATQKMSLFAGAFYASCYPNAKNVNLAGIEIDVGHPFNEPDNSQARPLGGRNGITILSMGSKKAALGQDCAINIVSGPQFQDVQGIGRAGWRVGLQFASNFAATGYGEPIAADGSLIRTIGNGAPFPIANAFMLDQCTISGSVLKTQNIDWSESVLEMKAATGGIVIGSNFVQSGTSFLAFRNGFNNTYGARFESGGGTATTGSAGVVLRAGTFEMPSVVGFGTTPVPRQTVTGSRGGNLALNAVIVALTNLGLITNNTTA